MSADLLLALGAFAFVSSITPGPNNLMLMASGTNFGLRRTLPHAFGVGFGFVLMLVLIGLGLARVFDAVPASYLVLKTASAAYLLYLAWKIAHASPPPAETDQDTDARPFSFLQAAAFQWVNPKAWAMALTAISVYTLPARPLHTLAIVALVFGLVNLPCILSWTILGTQLRHLLDNPVRLRAFNITAALLLVATLWPILTSGGLALH